MESEREERSPMSEEHFHELTGEPIFARLHYIFLTSAIKHHMPRDRKSGILHSV